MQGNVPCCLPVKAKTDRPQTEEVSDDKRTVSYYTKPGKCSSPAQSRPRSSSTWLYIPRAADGRRSPSSPRRPRSAKAPLRIPRADLPVPDAIRIINHSPGESLSSSESQSCRTVTLARLGHSAPTRPTLGSLRSPLHSRLRRGPVKQPPRSTLATVPRARPTSRRIDYQRDDPQSRG